MASDTAHRTSSTYAGADLAGHELEAARRGALRTWADLGKDRKTPVMQDALAAAVMTSTAGPRVSYDCTERTRSGLYRHGLTRETGPGARLTPWGLMVRDAGGCTRAH